jgi:3'-phosphoadenosine 5'-phosphosulfate sulfotransferase (PAPS reductase)/FAD synthetase
MGELIKKLAGRRVVASISGGKDSAAMSLHLTELGIEHDRVFMDTGWESPETYDYLRGELTRVIGPIVEIRGPLQMEDLIRKKGMFPSRARRFCTTTLKVEPMIAHLATIDDDVINAVGIRRAESEARSKMAEWEWSDGFDCEVWRPLLHWSDQQVVDAHKRHGLAPNPLYLKGARRVGCWPCIHSRKSEIKLISEIDPARIDRVRRLETEVQGTQELRRSKRLALFHEKGADGMGAADRSGLLDDSGNVKPLLLSSFFQAARREETGHWPIDRAVEWSKTIHGGTEEDRQQDMFGGSEGCMRWGLCETAGDE